MKSFAIAISFLLLPLFDAHALWAKPKGGDVSATVTGPSVATPMTGRAAWQWSLEERIALRSDPKAARERSRAGGPRVAATSAAGFRAPHADTISGKTDPHLFMPTELFESVVTGAFLAEGWREVYAHDIVQAGLPKDFLETLGVITGAYLPLLREQHRVRSSPLSAQERAVAIARLAALERELCAARQEALAAARPRFGVALDRFLYGPVARSRTMYFDRVSDAAALEAREKGCR